MELNNRSLSFEAVTTMLKVVLGNEMKLEQGLLI